MMKISQILCCLGMFAFLCGSSFANAETDGTQQEKPQRLEEVPTVWPEDIPRGPEYGYKAAWTPFQLGVVGRYQLFHPSTKTCGLGLGVLGVQTGDTTGLLLSPVYTSSRSLKGVAVTSVYSGSKGEGTSLQVALVTFSEKTRGAQLSGVVGLSDGPLTGLQLSGITSIASRSTTGAQLSLVYNISNESLRGFQAAAFNAAGQGTTGVQLAAVGNSLHRPSGRATLEDAARRNWTAQGALVYNHASDKSPTRGLMISGVCNWARNTFSGFQLGAVNLAGDMNGLQIGLLNDSSGLNGVQVGLFNFEEGRMRLPLINIGRKKGE